MKEDQTQSSDQTRDDPGAEFEFKSDYETLTPDERRKKVEAALFDAACSGNVTAGLQFLAMNPAVKSEDHVAEKRKQQKAKTQKPRKITVKEHRFIHAYFGEAKGNGTLAAKLAGYKGSDAVLATEAHRLLRKPKIAAAVAAMLQQSALPVEQVLKGISDIALGSVEFFLEFGENDSLNVTLKRAKEQGKLHLVKGLELHPNGTIKRIHWYDALQAYKALGMFHHTIKPPEKPPVDEPDADDLEAAEFEAARRAITLVMKKAKEFGKTISVTEARELAASRGFPKAADVPMPTTFAEGNM